MRIRPLALAGLLAGAGFAPLADATVLYPEEAAAMREAWVRATSRTGRTDRARGEPAVPKVRCRTAGIEGGLAPAARCRIELAPLRTP